MIRASTAAVACVIGLLSVSAEAAAQDDAAATAEARRVFEGATRAYDERRYEDALAMFRRAYELTGTAELQYNLGITLERLGRVREAIAAYERYVEEAVDATDRGDVQVRIAGLQRALEEPAPAPPEPASPEPTETESGGLFWTWVAAGTTIALGVAAAVVWASATADYADLEERCLAMGGCTDPEIDDAGLSGRITATNVLVGLTLAAAVATGVLLVLELGGGSDQEGVDVAVGPSSVAVRGRW